MSELYWLITLSNLGIFFCVIGTIVCAISALAFFMSFDDSDSSEYRNGRKSIRAFIIGCILIFGSLFIPNKDELCVIYGLGTIVDYVQENPKAKTIPDKVINIANNYLDKLNNDSIQ